MIYYEILKIILLLSCLVNICIHTYYLIHLKDKERYEGIITWVIILVVGLFFL